MALIVFQISGPSLILLVVPLINRVLGVCQRFWLDVCIWKFILISQKLHECIKSNDQVAAELDKKRLESLSCVWLAMLLLSLWHHKKCNNEFAASGLNFNIWLLMQWKKTGRHSAKKCHLQASLNLTVISNHEYYHAKRSAGVVGKMSCCTRIWWNFVSLFTGEWENACNELQRMLVVRSLRPDRVSFTATSFIINNLGSK